jgi:hypothetical protein
MMVSAPQMVAHCSFSTSCGCDVCDGERVGVGRDLMTHGV